MEKPQNNNQQNQRNQQQNSILVLDTNVLLINPNIIYEHKNKSIVIPFIVLEELDNLKTDNTNIGFQAREACRTLYETTKNKQNINNVTGNIRLSNGSKLIFEKNHSHKTENKNENKLIQHNKPDNSILAVCSEFNSEKNSKVTLVTNDINLSIKAKAFDVDTQEYSSNKNSYVDIDLEDLPKGIHKVYLDDSSIENFWKDYRKNLISPDAFLQDHLGEDKDKLLKNPNGFLFLYEQGNLCPISEEDSEKEKEPTRVIKIRNQYESSSKVLPDYNKKWANKRIAPKNVEQACSYELLYDDQLSLVTLTGISGSGKTLLALYAGLDQVLEQDLYDKMIICRPTQPVGKEIGYTPGAKLEKLHPWMAPIRDNLKQLISKKNHYDKLKQKFQNNNNNNSSIDYVPKLEDYIRDGSIELEALTYIRGRSFTNTFILLDEAQNITTNDLKAFLTRVGENTKIVLTGDVDQIDNPYMNSYSNGLSTIIRKFQQYDFSGHVSLRKGQRSDLATIASQIL